MSLVAPLKQAVGLGSAGNGFEPWWMQRVTAVALVVLGLWLAVALAMLPDFSFQSIVAWVQHPATTILLILAVIVASYHSYLGVRVVLEDYLHPASAKMVTIVLSGFIHFALAVVGIYSIARIAFGPTL